jgi:CheY-like chemotaxis protein
MPDLLGIRILVVDDDPDAREIFAASLIHAGAEVQTAASARQALTILKARVPDVVVTDMSMPGEDGLWLLNQIKRHSPEAARVPVVVVTGHAHLYRDRDMLSAGFQRSMTKPVDPWQLCATVRELAQMPTESEPHLVVCAFCRTPIRPTASSKSAGGVSYHSGCWDRKIRAGKS